MEISPSANGGDVLVEVRNLKKYYPVTKGVVLRREIGQVRAVDGVSFVVHKGEALGLVGESGCGKTTIARCLLKLMEPTSGSIYFDGQALETLDKRSTQQFRRRTQAIFQDPFSSLNPRMRVKDIIGETMGTYRIALRVPKFDDETLASSSLILADKIERVPMRSLGTGQFVIGSSKVRPRITEEFKTDADANGVRWFIPVYLAVRREGTGA